MKEENKKINIKMELSRGEEAIREAEVLFEKNFFPGAVSRGLIMQFFTILRLFFSPSDMNPGATKGLFIYLTSIFSKPAIFLQNMGRFLKELKNIEKSLTINLPQFFPRKMSRRILGK